MADKKEISQAVITRMPRYYRFLKDLKDEGVERISSKELSARMHVTASQIRQDFNHFGGFGQQGYGYNVDYVYEEIGKILGLENTYSMILVGAGNLGSALVNYMNFRNRGFYFKAAFDVKESIYGTKIGDVPVFPLERMTELLDEHPVDIAVLAIPKTEAVKVAQQLTPGRVRAIWNFAHVDLDVPEEIPVENVHLSDSLMKLSYSLNQMTDGKQEDA